MVAVASLEAMAPPVLCWMNLPGFFDARWLTVFEHWLVPAQGNNVVAISHDARLTSTLTELCGCIMAR